MSIYVTGRGGNLDTVLVEKFGCKRLECDISSRASIRKALENIVPDALINCAAVTSVDDCELDENRMKALRTNGAGVANLRDEYAGRIIHISTDYIFDGKDGPYDERDEPNPINWYGQTKLCGEERLREYNIPGDTIVRTTIVYGGRKPDFTTSVLRNLKDGKRVEVPISLYGTPTHVSHLARGILKLINIEAHPKIVNIAGTDTISRYEFALMIAHVFGYSPGMINPIKTVPGIAKRPKNAGLKTAYAKRLGIPLFSVLDGLQQLFLEKGHIYGRTDTETL